MSLIRKLIYVKRPIFGRSKTHIIRDNKNTEISRAGTGSYFDKKWPAVEACDEKNEEFG